MNKSVKTLAGVIVLSAVTVLPVASAMASPKAGIVVAIKGSVREGTPIKPW